MTDERGPPAWNEHVHEAVGAQERGGLGVGRVVGDVLRRVCGQAGLGECVTAAVDDRLAGVLRGRAPLEHAGVAGAQAEREGVGRDVGARLVDDGDHPERDAELLDAHARGERATPRDAADRVVLPGDLAQRRGYRAQAGPVEEQAVLERRGHPGRAGAPEVGGVGGADGLRARARPFSEPLT